MSEDFQHSRAPRQAVVFTDRRQPSDLDALAHLIEGLMNRIDNLDAKLTAHMETEPGEIKKIIEDTMQKGFPDGDPDGHRRAHEAWIKREEDSAKFWAEMRLAVGKWMGLGVLAFLATAAWTSFLHGPK